VNYAAGAFIILAALAAPPVVVLRMLPRLVHSKFAFACWLAMAASLGFCEGLLVVYGIIVTDAHGDVVSYAAAIFQAVLFGTLSLCTVGVLIWGSVFSFVPRCYLPLAPRQSARRAYSYIALATSIFGVVLAAYGFRLPTP
jgi:hypothetical protein